MKREDIFELKRLFKVAIKEAVKEAIKESLLKIEITTLPPGNLNTDAQGKIIEHRFPRQNPLS